MQVTSALKLILGEDGSTRGAQKILQLRANSNYMRQKLEEMGLAVLGDKDSPVMVRPIALKCRSALHDSCAGRCYNSTKMSC